MNVYRYYVVLGSREAAISWGESNPDIKEGWAFHLGFYKEQGTYVDYLGPGPMGRLGFGYSGTPDDYKLVSVDRNMTFPAGSMDLLCLGMAGSDDLIWILADYLGFAVQIGPNVFVIEP